MISPLLQKLGLHYPGPMILNIDDIKEFQSIYEEEFDSSLNDEDAREMATRVLWLYEILAQALPSEQACNLAKADGHSMLKEATDETPSAALIEPLNPGTAQTSPNHV